MIRSGWTSTSVRMTASDSAAASTGAAQNGSTRIPGEAAGINATPSRVPPSSPGIATLAVSRSIDRDRLHGRFAPLTSQLPLAPGRAVMVGVRTLWPAFPSAKPEATSRWSTATPSSSIHSKPVLVAASVTRLATEKWCMVVAMASDGEQVASARVTRAAWTALAPRPPCSFGTSRPGPPAALNRPSPGLPGCSSSVNGYSPRRLSRPGSSCSQVLRSVSSRVIAVPSPVRGAAPRRTRRRAARCPYRC